MLTRSLLAAVLTLCIVGVAWAQTSEPQSPLHWGQNTNQQSNTGNGGTKQPGPAASEVKPSPNQNDNHKETTHNLIGPEWSLVWVTIVLCLITFGLAVYTAFLYRTTRKLAIDAKETGSRQAADMSRSLKIAEDAAKATKDLADATAASLHTERAWMSHVGFTSVPLVNGKIDGKAFANGLLMQMNWRNTGRSPALGVQIVGWHIITGRDDPIPTFPLEDNTELRTGTIGPNISVSSVQRVLDDEAFKDFRERKNRVYFYSRVTYFSVFNQEVERTTEACAEIIYDGDVVDQRGNRALNIAVSFVGPQNTAT